MFLLSRKLSCSRTLDAGLSNSILSSGACCFLLHVLQGEILTEILTQCTRLNGSCRQVSFLVL
jgi:hypothetical protein